MADPRTTSADDLRIAGLDAFSMVDWPDRLVATVFLQGCPWDCFYCHNPDLIDPRATGRIEWDDVRTLLRERRGLLDGVVFSGGEPTMQRALLPAMRELRGDGVAVGLHTSGAFPLLLARALPHVDWVGLDIKAAVADYPAVTGRPRSGELAWRSLDLVLAQEELRRGGAHPLSYEVRTTLHPATDAARLHALADELADRGVASWAVQRFHETGTRVPLPRMGEVDGRADLALDDLPSERFARFAVR